MGVGEAFLSAFLQVLFDRLASNEFVGLLFEKNYEELLEKLKITVLTVTALLGDAEEKQFHSPAVVRWLQTAKDGIYDMEDLLDELATEALKCHLKAESQQSVGDHETWNWSARVSSTLTPSGVRGIESRMRKVIERLELVAKYKNVLGLRDSNRDRPFRATKQRLETTSLVEEGCVYGRDRDKEMIVNTLLRDEGSNVGVVPIVGMGGIGKTTLAQWAYNDARVVASFELRVWVCVTDQFDAVRVTKKILGSDGLGYIDHDDFNSLQVQLKKKLDGKRFLLVFDDVWSKRNGDWDLLWKPLRLGGKGSKVIVTTQNGDVAKSMGTVPAHRLRGLSDKDCWALFASQAFKNRAVGVDQNLQVIEEKIVKRCEGLPLAAKRLGTLLRSRGKADEWNDILNRKIWDLPGEESDILQTLGLTYLHLPEHLKQCFAFCAIFPAEHEYDKDSLVAMWMAEGFLQQPKGKKRLEEVGDEYFNELVSRSIFEPSVNNPSKFLVHSLLKELADFIAGEFCFRLEELNDCNQDRIFEKARHSSFVRGKRDELKRFKAFDGVKYLRTFLSLDPIIDNIGVSYLDNNVPRNVLPKLKYLRVLSFNSCRLIKLPNSIGDLKHLRYLNLSRTAIKVLPESTNNLYNLQTLNLSQCQYLAKLPSKMGNLKFLRHLCIGGTSLREMPMQICKLKNLQRLSNFIVGKDSGSGIKDLSQLSQLRGSLHISGLQNVVNFVDAIEANLKEKQELGQLVFQWNSFDESYTDSYEEEASYFPQHRDVSTRGYRSKRFPSLRETFNDYKQSPQESTLEESKRSEGLRDERVETLVLEMLQPHTNIKRVIILGYGGVIFPSWIESPLFSHINYLKLSKCNKCAKLPAFGQLPLLKDLIVEGMERVQSIGTEFYGDGQPSNLPFRSLETLKFDKMSNLEDWFSSGIKGREDFPRLQKIKMKNCPKLRTFPHSLPHDSVKPSLIFPSLLELSILACPNLKELPLSFPSLIMLELDECQDLAQLPDLPSICDLELNNCNLAAVQKIVGFHSLSYLRLCQIPNLTSLSREFFKNLTTLVELHIADMRDLATLSDEIGLHNIQSLERMEISDCTVLEEMPHSLQVFPALKELRVWGCPSLMSFPITGLPCTLKGLEIKDSESLQSLPNLKSSLSLEFLMIEACPSLTSLPADELPDTLKELEIQDCIRLESLTKRAVENNSSLEILTIAGCHSITHFQTPSCNLKQLIVNDCPNLKRLPNSLHNLACLDHLEIAGCPALLCFPEGGLPSSMLRTIRLSNCAGLKSLPSRMHSLMSLETLSIEGCSSVTTFPDGGLPVNLVSLSILNCENLLPSFQWGLHRLTRLADLEFGACKELSAFPNDWLLPNSLSSLQLRELPSLRSLPKGLKNLSSLDNLDVWGCDNLQTDEDQLSMLQKFDFWNVL